MGEDCKSATQPEVAISFVLPVFNEEGNLEEFYQKIITAMQSREEAYELVFVDDGSAAILERLHGQNQRLRVIEFRKNFGKSAAYTASSGMAQVDLFTKS